MARASPLLEHHRLAGATFADYGPPDQPIAVPRAFDLVEMEYAALRTGVAIIDQPQSGTLLVTGALKDRHEFLQRMVTQDLHAFKAGTACSTFWLSRKGRIDADLHLLELPATTAESQGRMVIEVDAFAAERAAQGLSSYLFNEDITIKDATDAHHWFRIVGPHAFHLLNSRGMSKTEAFPDRAVAAAEVAGCPVFIERRNLGPIPSFLVSCRADDAVSVHSDLAEPPLPKDRSEHAALRAAVQSPAAARPAAVRAGWHAFNIARIESGEPHYMIDFGPDSLPHETGILSTRVSFKKGCYLGQEVVARMQSLGHPKQQLRSIRFRADAGVLPVAGSPLTASNTTPTADAVIGAVTSSTFSPMLGDVPIAFAMLKWSASTPGQAVWGHGEGTAVEGVVQEHLIFCPGR